MSKKKKNSALYPLAPITNEPNMYSMIPTPRDAPDIIQLQQDVMNVVEGRIDIKTFDPEYQHRIKVYYKTTGLWSDEDSTWRKPAKLIKDTNDLI